MHWSIRSKVKVQLHFAFLDKLKLYQCNPGNNPKNGAIKFHWAFVDHQLNQLQPSAIKTENDFWIGNQQKEKMPECTRRYKICMVNRSAIWPKACQALVFILTCNRFGMSGVGGHRGWGIWHETFPVPDSSLTFHVVFPTSFAFPSICIGKIKKRASSCHVF